MSTYSNSAREVEMPDGNVVVLHKAPTGGANTTSNIKKFKYDDNGHVTESSAANATDLNLNSYSTPTSGSTAIGTSDAVQTAIGKLDHQSHIDQTNILSVLDADGQKNIFTTSEGFSKSAYKGSYTVNGNQITITSTTNWGFVGFKVHVPKANVGYVLLMNVDSKDSTISNKRVVLTTYPDASQGAFDYKDITSTGAFSKVFTPPTDITEFNVLMYCNNSGTTANTSLVVSNVMIVSAELYSISQTYQPFALPNYDLTRLQSEDRAGLVECVDGGAKNLLTKDTMSASGNWVSKFTLANSLPAGNYVFSANATFTESAKINCGFKLYTSTSSDTAIVDVPTTYSNGKVTCEFTLTQTAGALSIWTQSSGATFTNCMICTKAAFGVSNKFVPYRPNYDLVAEDVERHISIDNGSTNRSSITCDVSNWKDGIYMIVVNRSQTATTRYGTSIYFYTKRSDYTLPLFTKVFEEENTKITDLACTNTGLLTLTYGVSAYYTVKAMRV